jgi:hypothetical protein
MAPLKREKPPFSEMVFGPRHDRHAGCGAGCADVLNRRTRHGWCCNGRFCCICDGQFAVSQAVPKLPAEVLPRRGYLHKQLHAVTDPRATAST